ncbi:hypothetical protein [Sphingobium indicum]|uniref:hypothetical protein n=1 Tax=Sphingobium indicum TaxID=332055 RepID=UPI002F2B1E80
MPLEDEPINYRCMAGRQVLGNAQTALVGIAPGVIDHSDILTELLLDQREPLLAAAAAWIAVNDPGCSSESKGWNRNGK